MGEIYAFKGCPRDAGDLILERDIYGKYVSCLQCGYIDDRVFDNPEFRRSNGNSQQPTRSSRNGKYD